MNARIQPTRNKVTFSLKALLILTLLCAVFFGGRESQHQALTDREQENRRLVEELKQAQADLSKFESHYGVSRRWMNITTAVNDVLMDGQVIRQYGTPEL